MPARTNTVARTRRVQRSSQSHKAVEDPAPSKQYDIPYFAHMQLDPAHFPEDVGAPVGRTPYKVLPYGAVGKGNGAWEDSDDASYEVDDAENTVTVEMARANRSKAPKSADVTNAKHLSGSAYKKLKVEGGRPAMAKKVTANLDSDDELIVRMKNAKYLEKDIAERLAKEGRIHYHPKTIGTRWARIKKVLQQVQDELLDEELTDWHDGDDEILLKAIEKADADVEKAKRDADEKKWRIVADEMKALKPVVNFSQNACRARYEALQNGTAKPTPESIENPGDCTLARIQSRRDKEKKIEEDMQANGQLAENIDGNAWTSRMRTYY